MSTAIISGLIILALLVVMLIAGVPIAVALGISSVCAILPVMDLREFFLEFPYSVCWPFRFSFLPEIL